MNVMRRNTSARRFYVQRVTAALRRTATIQRRYVPVSAVLQHGICCYARCAAWLARCAMFGMRSLRGGSYRQHDAHARRVRLQYMVAACALRGSMRDMRVTRVAVAVHSRVIARYVAARWENIRVARMALQEASAWRVMRRPCYASMQYYECCCWYVTRML